MTPTSSASAAVGRMVLVLVAFGVGGVLAGLLWHALWTPPSGLYLQEKWHVDATGAPRDVSGTGLYVLLAAAAGIVLGFASALTARGHELATLAAVCLGSGVAGVLMAITGHAVGPEDPRPLAAGKPDYTAVVADLRVEGRSPYVAFPAGALTALAAAFLLLRDGVDGDSRKGSQPEPRR